jgi:hypothetical protein
MLATHHRNAPRVFRSPYAASELVADQLSEITAIQNMIDSVVTSMPDADMILIVRCVLVPDVVWRRGIAFIHIRETRLTL